MQGFRVAVNKATGEIKILKSVHAADAGRVANPMQCRGQVEGGVAQSLGAALYEEMVIDEGGRVVNPKFRDYHLPSFADIPRTEVYFADTSDIDRPDGRQVDERKPLQSGRGRARQRTGGCHRHPLHQRAVQAGPDVAGAAGEVSARNTTTVIARARRAHPSTLRKFPKRMDCRVKLGNDEG